MDVLFALASVAAFVAAFCHFSGLTQVIDTGAIGTTTDSEHPESETAPLQQFQRESWAGSEIRIAVADRGVGIGERLRRSEKTTNLKIRDDEHALQLVLKGNVSSKSRPNNRGQGLSILSLIAAGNGGQLRILSGRARAVVQATETRISPLPENGCPGTRVLLSLRVTSGDSGDDRE